MEIPGNISLKELAKRTPLVGIVALGATSLDILTQVQTAESAGPTCNPNRQDYHYTIIVRRAPFFEVGGKENIFDKGIDPWLEIPVTGGSVKAIERGTNKVLSEKAYQLDRPNFNTSLYQPKQGETNVAWSILEWNGNCDTETSANTPSGGKREIPGKNVDIVTTQDPDNKTFTWTAVAGGLDSVWTGRRYKTAEQFLSAYDQKPALARDLTPQTLQKIRDEVKRAIQQTEDQKRLAALEDQVKNLQTPQVNKTSEGSESKVADEKPQFYNGSDYPTSPFDWRWVVAGLVATGLLSLAFWRRGRRETNTADIVIPGQVIRVHTSMTPAPPVDIDITVKPGDVDVNRRQGTAT